MNRTDGKTGGVEMKKFKAVTTNKATGEKQIISSFYNNKKDFIKDLRSNGYSVNSDKVKLEQVFDYIIKNTNCTKIDWQEINAIGKKADYINNMIEDFR